MLSRSFKFGEQPEQIPKTLFEGLAMNSVRDRVFAARMSREWAKMQRHAQEWLAQEPESIEAMETIGEALEKQSAVDEALDFYERAFEAARKRNVPCYTACKRLDILYYRRSRYEDCLRVCQYYTMKSPDYYDSWNRLQRVTKKLGLLDLNAIAREKVAVFKRRGEEWEAKKAASAAEQDANHRLFVSAYRDELRRLGYEPFSVSAETPPVAISDHDRRIFRSIGAFIERQFLPWEAVRIVADTKAHGDRLLTAEEMDKDIDEWLEETANGGRKELEPAIDWSVKQWDKWLEQWSAWLPETISGARLRVEVKAWQAGGCALDAREQERSQSAPYHPMSVSDRCERILSALTDLREGRVNTIVFGNRRAPDIFVQFTEEICQVSQPQHLARTKDLIANGFDLQDGYDLPTLDHRCLETDRLGRLVETAFEILGVSPDFELTVQAWME
jgi:hypothetical protein